jgi:hypothetical protein
MGVDMAGHQKAATSSEIGTDLAGANLVLRVERQGAR